MKKIIVILALVIVLTISLCASTQTNNITTRTGTAQNYADGTTTDFRLDGVNRPQNNTNATQIQNHNTNTPINCTTTVRDRHTDGSTTTREVRSTIQPNGTVNVPTGQGTGVTTTCTKVP